MMKASTTFTTIQRYRLVDQVIQQLQGKISLGEFAPGSKIPPEPELMSKLGVGRSTLREAIRVMASGGMLDVRQGDGTYVRKQVSASEPLEHRLRRATVFEVFEARRIIEIEIVGLAAQRRTARDMSRIRQSLARRQAARDRGDRSSYLDADIDFHVAVAAATRNGVLADLYVAFSNVLRDALDKLVSDPMLHDDQMGLHQPLLEAIKKGDVVEAKRWSTEHLDRVMDRLRKALK